MGSAQEVVQIVDLDNNETGSATRAEMRAKGLPHRATYIFVLNTQGEIFVQKRTMNKDIYPGYLDVATGGVVLAGESYELSAERELAEELGVEDVPLTGHFDFFHEDGDNRVWGRLFTCTSDGPFTLQEEEVEDGFFMPIKEVLAKSEATPFCPDGIMVLKRYLKESHHSL